MRSSSSDIEIARLEERRKSDLAREKKYHQEEVDSLKRELDEQRLFITDLRENLDIISMLIKINRIFQNEIKS